MAKELEKHRALTSIAIKDMSGLLKPYAAKTLVSSSEADDLDIPIHLHTHDTTGNQVATLPDGSRSRRGHRGPAPSPPCARPDQPALYERCGRRSGRTPSGTPVWIWMDLQKLTDYWADVRERYVDFESDLKTPRHRYLSL